jgi:hypothetical protein
MRRIFSFKDKLCAKLDVTVVDGRLGYVAERCGIPGLIRISEIRMVENIEHFRAELEFSPLFHREIFENREVGVYELIFLCVSFFWLSFVGQFAFLGRVP